METLQLENSEDRSIAVPTSTEFAPSVEALVSSHLPLAHRLARRYAGRGMNSEDMRQVAAMGLVKAARGFDPKRGGHFPSYAVPTITGELRRHFRDQGWWVRPPRAIQEMRPSVTNAEQVLQQELGRAPTDAELAAEADVDVAQVREVHTLASCFSPRSIDSATAAGGHAPTEVMESEDPAMEQVETRLAVEAALSELPARDQRIIRMRFTDELTQEEIGQRIGVTQMQVSRLLTRILRDLRALLTEVPYTARHAAPTSKEEAMPQKSWSKKRERQYKHIKTGLVERGEDKDTAEEIAARTVNKERARHGESTTSSRTSTDDISSGRRGGLRSHSGPGGRTKDQLYAEARKKNIKGRSTMTKAQLERAVGRD